MTQYFVGVKIVKASPSIDGTTIVGYDTVDKDGYPAFIPRRQFEEINIPIGNIGHYPDWAHRLIAEHAILQNNHRKLIKAIQSGKVPESEIQILTEQWECMVHLDTILQARIDKLPK